MKAKKKYILRIVNDPTLPPAAQKYPIYVRHLIELTQLMFEKSEEKRVSLDELFRGSNSMLRS